MTKTVIISGSRSIKELPAEAIASLNRIIELQFKIIIGDAPGVDSLVLNYLRQAKYHCVKVYYALFDGKGKPRNTAGYPCIGVSGNYRDRDKLMCSLADYGLAIWDGKSIGTAENISRVQKTRVIWAKSEPMHKYSCVLDGMEVYDDGEGWCVYQCQLPVCKDGTPIQIGQKYHTSSAGIAVVVDRYLLQFGNQFIWRYEVIEEESSIWDDFEQYEFKCPALH